MRPTLLEGDYLFVTKWAYGYSRYSLPFSPNIFSGRIWGSEPERGDVVVFKFPPNPSLDYIKRVIGLPGDRIQDARTASSSSTARRCRAKRSAQIDNPDITEVDRPVDVYRETLPNGVSYDTLDLSPNGIGDNTREFVVPAGHYFMMGDNRDNSTDSRFDGRLRAGGKSRRPRQHHLLLDRRRRQPAGNLEMAVRMRPSRLFNFVDS